MRSQLSRSAQRLRSTSLSAIPPPQASTAYSQPLADLAAHILYRSPLPSQHDLPIFILNGAAFPDVKYVDYDALLPYVLARLPDEEELIGGHGYEVVFFAGGGANGATVVRKGRPGWGWFLQAYHVLTRATRKRLQRLWVVHEKRWVRVLVEMFSTVVSPKFRKKIVHVSTLTGLALHIPIEDLLIPPSVYLCDRRLSADIHAPYVSGRRAFSVKQPLPISSDGAIRLPRVLREATSFVMMDQNLKTEGIFRISALSLTVDILKEAYDRGQKFIVWREVDAVLSFPQWKQGSGNAMVEELDQTEGYGIHAATGLLKLWYRDLREPIFPQSCYVQLQTIFGDSEVPIDIPRIFELISPISEWSFITPTSRLILTKHLLPLLSKVAEHQDWNQMTPYNLSVCFGPTLLCGPDPVEDVKIGSTVRRLLEAAITHWKSTLAAACGMDGSRFEDSLRMPEAIEDREDALEEVQSRPTTKISSQQNGIVLLDNEFSDDDEDEEPKPPLPPRPGDSASGSEDDVSRAILPSRRGASAPIGATPVEVRRKPAPAVPMPPRYSVIMGEHGSDTEGLHIYESAALSGETEAGGGSQDVATYQVGIPSSSSGVRGATVPRKPLPQEVAKGSGS